VVDQIRETPMWAGLEAMAHTLVYDGLQMRDSAVPVDLLSSVSAPVLALYSNDSPAWLKDAVKQAGAALPHGTVQGHDGTFHTIPPATLAEVLTAYFVPTS
jgi:hypothetical protein